MIRTLPEGGEGIFITLHITAQPGPVKLIFQCYSNGSALLGVCVYVRVRESTKPVDGDSRLSGVA